MIIMKLQLFLLSFQWQHKFSHFINFSQLKRFSEAEKPGWSGEGEEPAGAFAARPSEKEKHFPRWRFLSKYIFQYTHTRWGSNTSIGIGLQAQQWPCLRAPRCQIFSIFNPMSCRLDQLNRFLNHCCYSSSACFYLLLLPCSIAIFWRKIYGQCWRFWRGCPISPRWPCPCPPLALGSKLGKPSQIKMQILRSGWP